MVNPRNEQSNNLSIDGVSQRDLRRMVDIVLGTEFGWDGVVKEIQKVQESLTSQMQSMESRLESRIEMLEDKIGRTPAADLDRKLLIGIMVSILILGCVVAWGVYAVANGGAAL